MKYPNIYLKQKKIVIINITGLSFSQDDRKLMQDELNGHLSDVISIIKNYNNTFDERISITEILNIVSHEIMNITDDNIITSETLGEFDTLINLIHCMMIIKYYELNYNDLLIK
jgi:hypothetical protein